MSVTLRTGDLVCWTDDTDERADGVLLVTEEGLQFQFGGLWHNQQIEYDHGEKNRGLTVEEAEQAINLGVYPVAFPGRVYKCYDAATDRSLPDPVLDLG